MNVQSVQGDEPPKEPCTTWEDDGDEDSPLVKEPTMASKDPEDPSAQIDKRGIIVSFVLLILSVPALIGAWCWPALVIGLISGTVTAAARALGHFISFGITGALMIAVNIYMYWSARKKRSGKYKYAPLLLTILAALLIMADLTRHVLQDTNVWPSGPWPGSSEYREGCPQENMKCLSVLGVFFTVICTYSGFVLLFVGTMWNANIVAKLKKIKKQWKVLRAAQK